MCTVLLRFVPGARWPVVLGAVRDASDSFAASLWLLAGIAAVLVAACARLRPVVISDHRLGFPSTATTKEAP